jgi:hypothetical protein
MDTGPRGGDAATARLLFHVPAGGFDPDSDSGTSICRIRHQRHGMTVKLQTVKLLG